MKRFKPRWGGRAAKGTLAAGLLGLAGCLGNPYASSVEAVNERAPQQPAAIQVSEPQLYARETLINDRRREAEYLEDLISKSGSVHFEPQLKRVLESIQALQASAKAGYAPSPGANRAEELARAQQEIELKTKQADLASANLMLLKAQQALQAAQIPAAPGSGSSDGSAPAASPDVTALTAQVKALQSQVTQQTAAIEDLKAKIGAMTSGAPPPDGFTSLNTNMSSLLPPVGGLPPSSITPSPIDLYRDRQAYRDELRAAQASVQLDDGHDVAAHALYRLQFQTTIAPGAVKNKFAVVRLKVKRGTLLGKDIESLYILWLGHVAYRSNGLSGPSEPSIDSRDPVYLAMGASSNLYRFVELKYDDKFVVMKERGGLSLLRDPAAPTDEAKAPWKLRVVVPPRLSDAAGLLIDQDSRELLQRLSTVGSKRPSFLALAPSASTECRLTSDDYEMILAIPYVAASLRAMGDWKLLDPANREAVEEIVGNLTQATLYADRIKKSGSEWAACERKYGSVGEVVPTAFSDAIRTQNETEGWSAAYATSPVELSQQISTTASALQSLQLALTLSAEMPLQGLTGNGSLNYLQAARGRVEALERLPLAVGFSDREECGTKTTPSEPAGTSGDSESTQDKATCAVFGWIFGPQATLDPESKKIKLVQRVRGYSATVDLSVPSWWPKLEMQLQTSWVGNWYGGKIIEPGDQRTIIKTLRPNRADLDNLTEALSARELGGAIAATSISDILPSRIAPCGDEVSLLVFGSNIWRGTEAYLDGVRASAIRTAPDMAGLYVTFNSQALRDIVHRGKAELVVWTRQGAAKSLINIVSPDACGSNDLPRLAIGMSSPRLVGSTNKIEIVSDSPLPSSPTALQVAVKGGPPRNLSVTPAESGDGRTITLTFNPALSAANITTNWTDGTVFAAKIKLADPLNSVGPTVPINRQLVFYKTEPTLKLDSGSASITGLDKPFTVIFPPNAETGFNGFDPTKLAATVEGGLFLLKVIPIGPQGKGFQYRLALTNPAQADDFKKANRNISLTLDTVDSIKCDNCLIVKQATGGT